MLWVNFILGSNFYFLGIVMYDDKFETKENKIWTMDEIEPQHIYEPKSKSFNLMHQASDVGLSTMCFYSRGHHGR